MAAISVPGPVRDHQQRTAKAALAQIGQKVGPRLGGLTGPGCQPDEHRLALGGDAPSGQHRFGRGPGMHPKERGVPKQIVQRDLVESPARPRLILGADRLADFGNRRLGDRGLIPERFGKDGLHIPDGQAAHERRDHQRLQSVGFRHMLTEQARRERCGGAAQLRPLQRDRPGSGFDRHRPIPVA